MQNDADKIIGVSPAYFVSKYGTAFDCNDVRAELHNLKNLGFRALQLEIFEKEVLFDWKGEGIAAVLEDIAALDLSISAFVAHFIGNHFSYCSESNLTSALSGFIDVLELIKPLNNSIPVAVPVLPIKGEVDSRYGAEILEGMVEIASEYGRELIVEIVPGSVAVSYSTFLKEEPWSRFGSEIGFLLDTGHANVTGENIAELIGNMGKRLKVLHLSDNDGVNNLSLKPGAGNIDWAVIVKALESISFKGNFDLEIVSVPESLRKEYEEGKINLNKIIEHQMLLKELI